MELGPITRIPADMLRPDALICFGEDPEAWGEALRAAGARPSRRHSHRGVHAWCHDEGLSVLAPWGSPAVEAVLWELMSRPGIQRIALWGTAGALAAYSGPKTAAVAEAQAIHMGAVRDGTYRVDAPEPSARVVSVDAFYGASDHRADRTWDAIKDADAMVDMETAAFYALMQEVAPDRRYCAFRSVANPIDALHAMPDGADAALQEALSMAMAWYENI